MTFDEWFRAEFGEPPTDKTAAELDNDVEIANQRYHQARNEFHTAKELRRSQHVWSTERNAAKYAWERAKNEVNK
jgi:multidrug resistance efflux pump